jgi:hypothetical protein
MTALLLTPTVLGLLLMAAHFFRAGLDALVVVSLLATVLVAVPRRWASWTLQAVLVLGAAEWVRTTVVLADVRQQMGLPAGRMMVILGAVALVTLTAAALHWTPRLRRRFGF